MSFCVLGRNDGQEWVSVNQIFRGAAVVTRQRFTRRHSVCQWTRWSANTTSRLRRTSLSSGRGPL